MNSAFRISLAYVSLGIGTICLAAAFFIEEYGRAYVTYPFGWPLIVLALVAALLIFLQVQRRRPSITFGVLLAGLGIGLLYAGAATFRDMRLLLVAPLAGLITYVLGASLEIIREKLLTPKPGGNNTTNPHGGVAVFGLLLMYAIPVVVAPSILFFKPIVLLENTAVTYDRADSNGDLGLQLHVSTRVRGYTSVHRWELAAFLVAQAEQQIPTKHIARFYSRPTPALIDAVPHDFRSTSGEFFLPYTVVEHGDKQLAPVFFDSYRATPLSNLQADTPSLRLAAQVVLLHHIAKDEIAAETIGFVPLDGRDSQNFGNYARSKWAQKILASEQAVGLATSKVSPTPQEEKVLLTVIRASDDGKVVLMSVTGGLPEIGSEVVVYSPASTDFILRKATGTVTSKTKSAATVILDSARTHSTVLTGDLAQPRDNLATKPRS